MSHTARLVAVTLLTGVSLSATARADTAGGANATTGHGPAQAAPSGRATPLAPNAMKVFARIDVAQAEQKGQSEQKVQGASANQGQSSEDQPGAIRKSSQTEVRSQQPQGPFPTNDMTQQPVIAIPGGSDGYKKDVAALQQTLTELQQLQLQTKQAHWNASGTLYYPLHLLLQEHYEGISKYADTIAERLLAIGSSADGRGNTIVKTSGVPEIPGGFLDDAQILVWFTNAYKRVGEEVNTAIKTTEEVDPTTSNLLQEVEHGIAKYQWQMRAQLQRTQTDPNTGWNLNNNKPVDLTPQSAPAAGNPRP